MRRYLQQLRVYSMRLRTDSTTLWIRFPLWTVHPCAGQDDRRQSTSIERAFYEILPVHETSPMIPPIVVLVGDPKHLANLAHRFNPETRRHQSSFRSFPHVGIIPEGKTMVVDYDNLMPIIACERARRWLTRRIRRPRWTVISRIQCFIFRQGGSGSWRCSRLGTPGSRCC